MISSPSRHDRLRIALAVAAAALVAAGCAGAREAASGPASSATAPSTSTTTATTPARPTTVRPTTPPRTPAPSTPTAGTTFAGDQMSPAQAEELQDAVDEGHQPWRLDVASVASAFVANRFGWTNANVALADPHTAEVTHPADGRMLTLQLRQPVREGPAGIWVVDSGVWLH